MIGDMTDYSYTIVRRPKRRTVSINISIENDVRVLAPPNVPEQDIADIVLEKEDWIFRVIEKNDKHRPQPKQFVNGEIFYFLGSPYPLKIEKGDVDQVLFQAQSLTIIYTSESFPHKNSIRKTLINWYKERAKEIVLDRVEIHANTMGLSYNTVRIKTLKSRWGSCSTLKNLNFNWALMMTPMLVLDYIVVHELAHLIHMNHSKAFWGKVAEYCPNYKIQKKWLRDHHQLLRV